MGDSKVANQIRHRNHLEDAWIILNSYGGDTNSAFLGSAERVVTLEQIPGNKRRKSLINATKEPMLGRDLRHFILTQQKLLH